jgi:hypothetical protein
LRALLEKFSVMPSTVRLQRAHTVALAATRPGLAVAIGSVQEALTDGWATALTTAQRR